jgi:ParB family protein of integrating conjugative element (PFGI_1 class)
MNKDTDFGAMLDRPHFTTGGGDGELPPDPAVPTLILVNLDNLVPYQGNPRQSRNPAYEEIKESIRAIGLQNPPNVTRADPSDPYMIRDGGNTRLEILRELWEETQDRRFFEFKCMFHPYTDDMDLLIKHCIENEMRGGMLLIERGLAALRFKETLESNGAHKCVSNKALARELGQKGWSVGDVVLGVALYAATLVDVIPVVLWSGMGKDQVQRLRKNITDCRNFWLSLEDKQSNQEEAEEEFTLIWQEALREVDSEDLTVDQARDAIEGAMADYLGCPVMTLRGDIQAMSEGVSRGGSVPKSVLTGQLPDLTVKPEAKLQTQAPASRTGKGSTTGSEIRQEAAKSSAPETATAPAARNQEAATRTSDQETAVVWGQGETFETESYLEEFGGSDAYDQGTDLTNGHDDSVDSIEEIREEILLTAERLAGMYKFEELVVPGDHLAPGTDHFGYLMLPPTPEVEARFIDMCFNRGETAPAAIYRQLLNMSFACKFVFANSPDLKFFDYLTAKNSPEECDMRLQGEGWLAAVRISMANGEPMRLIQRIERLALQLIQLHQHA